MKYLGLDYGTKRVGIALSDDAGEFAFPHSIVATKAALEVLPELLERESVQGIVLGESVASNGAPNAVAGKIDSFEEKLKAECHIPIYRQSEQFSSVEAHRYQTTKGSRDDSAAAIILQRFLDKKKKVV